MAKNVWQLSANEMNQLKVDLFWNEVDLVCMGLSAVVRSAVSSAVGRAEKYTEIPDSIVCAVYRDCVFSDEDFIQ